MERKLKKMHFNWKHGIDVLEPTCKSSRTLFKLMNRNLKLDELPMLAELGFMVQFDGDKTSSLYLSQEFEKRELPYTISQDREHVLYEE